MISVSPAFVMPRFGRWGDSLTKTGRNGAKNEKLFNTESSGRFSGSDS